MTDVLVSGPRIYGKGRGKVIHYSRRAVNVEFGGRVVTIMNRDGTVTPSGVVLDVPFIEKPSECTLEGKAFSSDSISFTICNVMDMHIGASSTLDVSSVLNVLMPFALPVRGSVMSALLRLPGSVTAGARSALEKAVFDDEVAVLERGGDYRTVASNMLGKGFGLTPSGDDFVVGMIAILRSIGRSTEGMAEAVVAHGDAYSGTMIMDALDGFYSLPLLALLKSLLSGTTSSREVRQLLSTGHTSGHDTLAGMLYVLGREAGRSLHALPAP